MLITPSGMEYNKLKAEDIVYVDNNFKAHGKESHQLRHLSIWVFFKIKMMLIL